MGTEKLASTNTRAAKLKRLPSLAEFERRMLSGERHWTGRQHLAELWWQC